MWLGLSMGEGWFDTRTSGVRGLLIIGVDADRSRFTRGGGGGGRQRLTDK